MGIGAVILAAGSSSRMGSPKQILQYRGESLLRRAALAAIEAQCSPVIVVTGANADAVRHAFDGLEVTEAKNGEWETGLASSIRAGIEGLVAADANVSAAVLILADQPHVHPEVIARLIETHEVSGRAVVSSLYASTTGVPALFARSLFSELAQLHGTAGAKQVIESHSADAAFISFEQGAIDIDTREDFARLLDSDVRGEG